MNVSIDLIMGLVIIPCIMGVLLAVSIIRVVNQTKRLNKLIYLLKHKWLLTDARDHGNFVSFWVIKLRASDEKLSRNLDEAFERQTELDKLETLNLPKVDKIGLLTPKVGGWMED